MWQILSLKYDFFSEESLQALHYQRFSLVSALKTILFPFASYFRGIFCQITAKFQRKHKAALAEQPCKRRFIAYIAFILLR